MLCSSILFPNARNASFSHPFLSNRGLILAHKNAGFLGSGKALGTKFRRFQVLWVPKPNAFDREAGVCRPMQVRLQKEERETARERKNRELYSQDTNKAEDHDTRSRGRTAASSTCLQAKHRAPSPTMSSYLAFCSVTYHRTPNESPSNIVQGSGLHLRFVPNTKTCMMYVSLPDVGVDLIFIAVFAPDK